MKDSLITLLEYYLEQLRSNTLPHGHQELLWDRLTIIPSVNDQKDLYTNYFIGQYIRSLCSSKNNP